MAKKRGARSRSARKQESPRSLLVDAVVVFGIVVSLGLIAVSVALNYRMGFRSADNALDGRLYGMGAAFGDCLKAIAPFMLSWGLRNGDALAAASAAVLFGVCTIFSFVSAVGFAAEHRASKAGIAQVELDGYGDQRGEKKRLEGSLALYGAQRSVAEVEQAIAAKLKERVWVGGQTVGALSGGCEIDRKSTRAACEAVAKLRVELSTAREVVRLTDELRGVVRKLAVSDEVNAPVTADAQVDVLAEVAGLMGGALSREQIGLGLSLLLACFIEVGSGVGLFMATTPWRPTRRALHVGGERRRQLGLVEAYMLARVAPGEGILSAEALYGDYARWCSTNGVAAQSEMEFSRGFLALAGEAGIEVTSRGQVDYYRHVQFGAG